MRARERQFTGEVFVLFRLLLLCQCAVSSSVADLVSAGFPSVAAQNASDYLVWF